MIALIGLLILAMALVALYLNRRLAAREILVGWLDRRGIEADVEVERLELNGFVGKITIGDPDDPQVRVDRVEVDYQLGMPWSEAGLSVTPSRIRLVRPLARASWKKGRLSLGSLDPLIEEFTARPPRPDSRAPLVLIERGQALLDTDYGPVRVMADARIDNSRLIALKAQLPQTLLKSGQTLGEAVTAEVNLQTRGDVVSLDLSGSAGRLVHGSLDSQGTRLSLSGTLPYPDARTRQSRGPVALTGQVSSDQLAQGNSLMDDLDLELDIKGELKGWIDTFTFAGQASATATADQARSGSTRAEGLTLATRRSQLTLSREAEQPVRWQLIGPAEVSARQMQASGQRLSGVRLTAGSLSAGGHDQALEVEGPVRVRADRLRSGDLDLRQLRGQMRLDLVRDGVTRFKLDGALRSSEGAYTGLGPARPGDLPEFAALKQSLSRFAVEAPAVSFHSSNAGMELNIVRAVEITPANGGRLVLAAGRAPMMALQANQPATGALQITSEPGGGLPEAGIEVNRWTQVAGGLEAEMEGQARMDMGPARGLSLETRGSLRMAGGTTSFRPADCLPLSIRSLDFGSNDLTDVSGNLCPTETPLLVIQNGQTRIDTQLDGVRASAPSVAAELRGGQGRLRFDARASGISLDTDIQKLGLHDTSDPARFHALDARGTLSLAANQWKGHLDLSRTGTAVGELRLLHDGPSGQGQLDIQTPELTFTQFGLQPADLSPLAARVMQSPVEGAAQFRGQFAWSAQTSASSGQLTIPGLDFVSPAGKVEGLKGTLDFTSLNPLATASSQRVHIDRLETVVPLTDLDVEFALQDQWLKLAGGTINAAGGQITIEPFDIPLNSDTPWNGVILINGIQLNELLKTANLQDRATLDSVVSGRLPFTFSPQEGWRIQNGTLQAIRPGRLSIEPEVFDELDTGGTPDALPPNAMQDLAYQALEDLAISDLSAEVNSLDNGRLGIRFRIHGRHDPPQREQLRLTLMELIRRDFLNRKLNLPSDTPIDLMLDTTWNANQIASDLMDYIRRGETP